MATMNARLTPYETLFGGQVAEATRRAGITEADIPDLMRTLTPKLDGQPKESGRDIREIYDLVNSCPLPEYEALGASVQQELAAELGLIFD